MVKVNFGILKIPFFRKKKFLFGCYQKSFFLSVLSNCPDYEFDF